MNVEDKIEEIRDFLSSPDNRLIWSKNDGQVSAGTFFDFEVSTELVEKKFIKCINVQSVDEAFTILRSVTINIDDNSLKAGLEDRMGVIKYEQKNGFYLIFKGNFDS